jgi:hypothetical protein
MLLLAGICPLYPPEVCQYLQEKVGKTGIPGLPLQISKPVLGDLISGVQRGQMGAVLGPSRPGAEAPGGGNRAGERIREQ